MHSDEKFYVYSEQAVPCHTSHSSEFSPPLPTRRKSFPVFGSERRELNLNPCRSSETESQQCLEKNSIPGRRMRRNSMLLTADNRINELRFPKTARHVKPERRFSLPVITDTRIQPNNMERTRRMPRLTKIPSATHECAAKARFRLIAKVAIFCSRQAKLHGVRGRDEDDELSPFINQLYFGEYSALHRENDGKLDLLFDPSKFKANRQIRISEETKRILCKPIDERTEQELYSVKIALRNTPCIAEYPARMQKKIAEVGRYEKYEAKRMIVRQGHQASSFYFILSGAVVVIVMDVEHSFARPMAYLGEGKTFGELAIINRSTRQSTVITKETCQFLSISVDDYHKIFMLGGVKTITDPDHISFLRSLDFLENWPIERLHSNPSKCMFLYFKRGEVLAKDSHYFDWIIVVKSGSIQVLKKLRRVKASERTETDSVAVISGMVRSEQLERRNKWRPHILPEIRISLTGNDSTNGLTDGSILAKPLVHQRTNHEEHSEGSRLNMFPEISKVQKRLKSKYGCQEKSSDSSRSSSVISIVSTGCIGDDVGVRLPPLTVLTKVVQLARQKKRVTHLDDIPGTRSVRKSRSKSTEQDTDHIEQHIRTIHEDLDAGNKRKDPDDITAADLNPEFVHVQTLTKGHVFGLAHLILGDQPSFCVVSNSADCILVDKQFYIENASELLIRKMRNELCPYPSEDELQRSLQTSVDWLEFRKTTLKSTVRHLRSRRTASVH